MNITIVLLIAASVLFLLAFFSKRRFGVLGLALSAGYVLQRLWEPSFPAWASHLTLPDQIVLSPLTIIGLLLLLLPSLLLLFGGPTYKNKTGRLIGSGLYALLAVLFGMTALSGSMNLTGESRHIFDTVMQYRSYILTAALVLAVVDVVLSRSSIGGRTHKKGRG